MIKINLLPYREIQKREKSIQQLIFGCFIIVAVLVAVGVIHWYMVSTVASLEEDKIKLEDEIKQYEKKIGEIGKLKSQKGEIERKLQVIDMLNERRITTANLLFKTAQAIPSTVWLTTFADKEKDVAIDGIAQDPNNVATLMDSLKAVGIYQNVTLGSMDSNMIGDKKYSKFNLILKKAESGSKP